MTYIYCVYVLQYHDDFNAPYRDRVARNHSESDDISLYSLCELESQNTYVSENTIQLLTTYKAYTKQTVINKLRRHCTEEEGEVKGVKLLNKEYYVVMFAPHFGPCI